MCNRKSLTTKILAVLLAVFWLNFNIALAHAQVVNPGVPVSGAPANNDCAKFVVSGGSVQSITTNGAGCSNATTANPTAIASDVAQNGVASTVMRSDAAPAVQKATNSQFGLVEPDAFGICISGGVISLCLPQGPMYASASGSDTNNFCLASGSPCTLKGACATRNKLGPVFGGININIADGTYSSTDGNSALCTNSGNSGNGPVLTTLIGNCTTPANVVLAVPNSSIGINNTDGGENVSRCITITAGTNANGIVGGQFTVNDVDNVHFGAFGAGSVHVSLADHAVYNLTGSGEFLDGATFFAHIQMRGNAIVHGAGGTSVTTNITFSIFLDTRGAVYIDLSSWTFTNSGSFTTTGQRANLIGTGYMITAGAASCNTFIPGNSACNLQFGFQDNAGDPLTPPLSNRQVLSFGNNAVIAAGATLYCWSQTCVVTQGSESGTFPIAGTIKNLSVNLNTAPGAGQSSVFTLCTGSLGAEVCTGTRPTCTISSAATSCQDNTNSVAVSANQTVTLKAVAGAAAAGDTGMSFGVEFDNP